MGKLIARIGAFEVRKTEEFNFKVIHETQGQMGVFRTEQRARDLVDMFVNPDAA